MASMAGGMRSGSRGRWYEDKQVGWLRVSVYLGWRRCAFYVCGHTSGEHFVNCVVSDEGSWVTIGALHLWVMDSIREGLFIHIGIYRAVWCRFKFCFAYCSCCVLIVYSVSYIWFLLVRFRCWGDVCMWDEDFQPCIYFRVFSVVAVHIVGQRFSWMLYAWHVRIALDTANGFLGEVELCPGLYWGNVRCSRYIYFSVSFIYFSAVDVHKCLATLVVSPTGVGFCIDYSHALRTCPR